MFNYYPNDFFHKRKIDNFDPYSYKYTCATYGFVLRGHMYIQFNWVQ